MFYNAKDQTLKIKNTYMDYVVFGKGTNVLILIPGLSVKGIKGTAVPLAYMYRVFAEEYKVYIFDRIHDIPENYMIEDMAKDVVYAMRQLGIGNADVVGISQGGMIAQALAIGYPSLVKKIVLGVTLSRPNETVKTVVQQWIQYAKADDYKAINQEIFTLMYSDAYLKKYRFIMPTLVRLVKPESLKKFAISANACITFDVYEQLDKIKIPVLVLGGKEDKIVTGKASEEIAEKLGCDIYMYEHLGHAAYEEAEDFNQRIYHFLRG